MLVRLEFSHRIAFLEIAELLHEVHNQETHLSAKDMADKLVERYVSAFSNFFPMF